MRKPKIEILLSEQQKVNIKIAAAQARVSISEYCLEMISKGKVIAPFSPEELKLQRDILSFGGLLNQYIRAVNARKDTESINRATELIKQIEGLLK